MYKHKKYDLVIFLVFNEKIEYVNSLNVGSMCARPHPKSVVKPLFLNLVRLTLLARRFIPRCRVFSSI